jgi:hypothetical protein
MVAGWYARRRAAVAAVALLCAAAGTWQTIAHRSWRLTTPSGAASDWRAYPVGAVDHLAAIGFSGDVLTEFEAGSYLTWRLHPAVKVSLDSRYEVAFPEGVLEDHVRLLRADPGWRDVLARYPPDAILLRRAQPIVPLLEREPPWALAYADAGWALFVRRPLDAAAR